MNLCEKLIVLRKENGWSQEDFAEKLDVSRQAVSRWENGTALPDSQNILRISKLFGVTADYLLNDDHTDGIDIPAADTTAEESKPKARKKNRLYWYLIPAICLIILSACAIMEAVRLRSISASEEHSHPELVRVIENQLAPTCTEQGSYDEVLYCAECGKEVLRTQIKTGMPTHKFENQICTVCGKEQRERD